MYTIRKATVKDVETIRSLAKEIWYDTYLPILAEAQLEYMLSEIYSTKKLTTQINNNEQTFLVLLEDEQIVAFAAYSPREEVPDIYKLHKIYCLPATQGKGYGKVLINTVCDAVIKAGKHILELNVNRHNKAKDFYEKMGFKVIYEEDIPIGPYFMNDYVMRKEIADFK
jgi:N-acetylglutamate synthase-like GNAT family acetyltransferase